MKIVPNQMYVGGIKGYWELIVSGKEDFEKVVRQLDSVWEKGGDGEHDLEDMVKAIEGVFAYGRTKRVAFRVMIRNLEEKGIGYDDIEDALHEARDIRAWQD